VGIGTGSPTTPLQVSGSVNDLISVIASGSSRGGIYIQNTNASSQSTLYTDNNRGSFASYCGFLSGGSSNSNTLFGLSRADRGFFIADGASNLGLGVGTLTAQPLIFGTNNAERMRITSSGNVGIGTTSPNAPLQVKSSVDDIISVIGSGSGRGGIYNQNTNSGGHADLLIENDHGSLGSYCVFAIGGSANAYSNIFGLSRADRPYLVADGPYNLGLSIGTLPAQPLVLGTNNTERMRIDGSGHVGIGTTNTQGYLLAVNGSAVFTSAKVKAYSNWPDYVFNKDYQPPSLEDLQVYIGSHHHLPDVPSADSIEANGIDLGSTQVALLKKIEELTLYVINENKTLKAQNQKISQENQELIEQNARLVAQQKEIDELKALIRRSNNH
jgi:hypothetical protein